MSPTGLAHGIVTESQVRDALRRMAAIVDRQNGPPTLTIATWRRASTARLSGPRAISSSRGGCSRTLHGVRSPRAPAGGQEGGASRGVTPVTRDRLVVAHSARVEIGVTRSPADPPQRRRGRRDRPDPLVDTLDERAPVRVVAPAIPPGMTPPGPESLTSITGTPVTHEAAWAERRSRSPGRDIVDEARDHEASRNVRVGLPGCDIQGDGFVGIGDLHASRCGRVTPRCLAQLIGCVLVAADDPTIVWCRTTRFHPGPIVWPAALATAGSSTRVSTTAGLMRPPMLRMIAASSGSSLRTSIGSTRGSGPTHDDRPGGRDDLQGCRKAVWTKSAFRAEIVSRKSICPPIECCLRPDLREAPFGQTSRIGW